MTHVANGTEAGRHRADLGRWRRLVLGIGSVFHSQRRQCRTGHHRFAKPAPIGGGILRHTCTACGAVSLDIREAFEPADTQLFKRQGELETFAILRRETFHH